MSLNSQPSQFILLHLSCKQQVLAKLERAKNLQEDDKLPLDSCAADSEEGRLNLHPTEGCLLHEDEQEYLQLLQGLKQKPAEDKNKVSSHRLSRARQTFQYKTNQRNLGYKIKDTSHWSQ